MISQERLRLEKSYTEINSNNSMKTSVCYFQMPLGVVGRGRAAVKGCFLIAQLEMAFVEPKFYLYKMVPRLPPKMHGVVWIKTEKRNQFTQQEIWGNR